MILGIPKNDFSTLDVSDIYGRRLECGQLKYFVTTTVSRLSGSLAWAFVIKVPTPVNELGSVPLAWEVDYYC